MKKMKEEEMKSINGGAIKLGIILAIGALASFIAGIIDGYVRPLTCRG